MLVLDHADALPVAEVRHPGEGRGGGSIGDVSGMLPMDVAIMDAALGCRCPSARPMTIGGMMHMIR